MTQKSLEFDEQIRAEHGPFIGLDEVGRGSLVGPLLVAGVILPSGVDIPMIGDSKQIPKHEHKLLVEHIMHVATEVRLGWSHVDRIAEYNILEADRMAMRETVNKFEAPFDYMLIDGSKTQELKMGIPEGTLVKGDAKSLSIGAASLVAKYYRDKLLEEMDKMYPGYGFAHNSGYATEQHRQALKDLGYTPEHRLTFAPLKGHLEDYHPWGGGES